MKLIDSHCHLDDRQFDEDREQMIERALAAGVGRMLAIGTGNGPPDLEAGMRLAREYPFMYATVGVHPHDAAKATPETFARLEALAGLREGAGHRRDRPRLSLRLFAARGAAGGIRRAVATGGRRAGKPVVIHTREAWEDTLRAVARALAQGAASCTASPAGRRQARQALDLGFHLSFGGVLTFPKADAVREAARLTPEDRLLVETDCPYLAPVPQRGKRNEPAFLVETVRRLAEVRGVRPEHIAEVTTRQLRTAVFARRDR